MMRTHGITRAPEQLLENQGPWWYEMQALGFNDRMPDILAALGTSQLRKTGPWLTHRRELAALYRERFAEVPGVSVQELRPEREHAYHLFPVLVDGRDQVYASLREQGIYAQVHYIPVHVHPYYVQRYGVQSFPNSERFYSRVLSLPLFHTMNAADVDRTVQAVALACADG
jgi:dTDP-4-amino-4,6-dideoxygalactose transaminase